MGTAAVVVTQQSAIPGSVREPVAISMACVTTGWDRTGMGTAADVVAWQPAGPGGVREPVAAPMA